jgi:shikimate kinase
LLSGVRDEDLAEFIAKHLFERQHFYAMAEHKISVDKLSSADAAARLAALIQTK